jgi:hypothetical protein
MTDVVALAAQVSTPIKVAWLLWMIWVVCQVASYRWMRRQRLPVSDPASSGPAQPPLAAAVSRPRRRRRRRLPSQHEPGAFQEIGA